MNILEELWYGNIEPVLITKEYGNAGMNGLDPHLPTINQTYEEYKWF